MPRLTEFQRRAKHIDAKQAWLSEFEDHVVALDEKHRGKIEWSTAHYFRTLGRTPEAAAAQYVETRK